MYKTSIKYSKQDLEFPYAAHMHWDDVLMVDESWSELCARGIEVFGLPGDRYMTHVSENYMSWHFRDQHDLCLFLLAWPAKPFKEKSYEN